MLVKNILKCCVVWLMFVYFMLPNCAIYPSSYPTTSYTVALDLNSKEVGCCGADGPRDYLTLNQPLPSQCRDTVTGNPFFHGCVDELTWFFEEKCAWVAALAMTVCFLHVINIVLATVLMQALKKEEEQADSYRK